MPAEPLQPLTDLQRSVLEFARIGWKHEGRREATIRELFGWSLVRYHQVLNKLLDHPEALAYDPVTVRRLTRIRDARKQARSYR